MNILIIIIINTIANTITTSDDTARGAAATPFLYNLFEIDFDVIRILQVSRLKDIEADTQDRFLNGQKNLIQ